MLCRPTHLMRLLVLVFALAGWGNILVGGTVTVTSTADSGAGSLRQAIANALAGDTVDFNLPDHSVITLGTPLVISKALTITGPGAELLTLDGGSGWSTTPALLPSSGTRIMDIATATVSLSGLRFRNAYVSGAGMAGASTGENGAAIRILGASAVTVDGCWFSNNFAKDRTTDPPVGGAIHLDQGTLTALNSSFHDNYAGAGSAICNYAGAVSLTNCTLSGNIAYSGGAFIHVPGSSVSTLTRCTIADNLSLNSHDSAGVSVIDGSVILKDCIVSGNSLGQHVTLLTRYADLDPNWNGTGLVASQGGNVLGCKADVAFTLGIRDQVGTLTVPADPKLQALDLALALGGHTPYRPLLSTSPAIDNGVETGGVDQRGVARISNVDSGAYEYVPVNISGSTGIAGANLTYTDGVEKTATADASGLYSITVPPLWTGTVTPSRAGYTFAPSLRSYSALLSDQTSQDFVASPIVYTVSGSVGVASATLSYDDGTPKTATADSSGNYSFTVSYNWSGTVTPTKAGTTFTPANKVYSSVLSNQTAQDYLATAITYTISGNAGVGGATLAYDDGTPKTATADSSGNYSFTVSYNWSGTVTPTKAGTTFTPASKAYTGVLSSQAAQDYLATAITYTISGNAGVGGATLAYDDGTPKTATADSNGNYSLSVPYDWSGTVTPAKVGITFTPASKVYSSVLSSQTAQDYLATAITYTISGNAGVSGATLAYADGGAKTATADSNGNYSFTVSYNWSGTVTPTKTGYTFTLASKAYTGVLSSQAAQDYLATAITYTISGNTGVGGATLAYADGGAKTATADSNGNYSFTVSYNWSGTVTPTKTGYAFTPASKAYTGVLSSQATQSYVATAITYTISGNAGVGGATLSYVDGGAKTTTADSAGNYSFTVSYDWSGTVTPAKAGTTFSPVSKVYTGVLSSQTAQDYVATAITYTISGNAGVGGATLTYTDGAPKTATADSSGNYSFTVSYNWSGTVTLTKTGYTFTPASKAYSSVLSNQAAQDYVGTAITYTISGNTGVGGATLAYADGGAKTATADSNGNYSFTVSYNWSGSLTPSKAGFSFSPTSRSFVNVLNDQGGTAFTAALSAPSSPQASAISGTGFVAGWDSNPAATGYLLDVSASSTFTSFLDGFHDLSVTELFATVTSLKPATTYYFRVRAKSSSHTSEYAVSSGIATSAIAPDATTLAADGVTPTSATLNASVNAQNSSTTVTFEYGPTALLGFSVTATLSPVTGMSDTQVSAQLSNLAPLTQYYFRVVAENAGGPAAGSLLNFTTPHMPAVLVQTVSPSSAPVGKVITVSGSGFTGATSVVLGGMEAIFTVVSDTELSCIVPPGAITGVIKVSSPAGTGESADAFTVEMEG